MKVTYARERQLSRDYGLTPQQLGDMIDSQRGQCAICRKYMRKPHVDHDHDTGEVRELLCVNCNTGLGMFKDDPRLLAYAIVYLEKHGKSF